MCASRPHSRPGLQRDTFSLVSVSSATHTRPRPPPKMCPSAPFSCCVSSDFLRAVTTAAAVPTSPLPGAASPSPHDSISCRAVRVQARTSRNGEFAWRGSRTRRRRWTNRVPKIHSPSCVHDHTASNRLIAHLPCLIAPCRKLSAILMLTVHLSFSALTTAPSTVAWRAGGNNSTTSSATFAAADVSSTAPGSPAQGPQGALRASLDVAHGCASAPPAPGSRARCA